MTETTCTEPIIEVANVSKTFRRIRALDRVSLTVHANEIFGLLGPNGSGKTTLLRILATLISPDSKDSVSGYEVRCRIAGHDLFHDEDGVRQAIGYVPQRDSLYTDLSAQDNLIFFSTPHTLDGRHSRIIELLHVAKLYDRRSALVRTFSGGMVKRLSIICALAHNPPIMILDEATMGLDTETRSEIWNLIREIKKGRAVIATTHNMNEAEEYFDRVALLFEGRLLDVGTPTDLVRKYPPARDLDEAVRIIQRLYIDRRSGGPGQLTP